MALLSQMLADILVTTRSTGLKMVGPEVDEKLQGSAFEVSSPYGFDRIADLSVFFTKFGPICRRSTSSTPLYEFI